MINFQESLDFFQNNLIKWCKNNLRKFPWREKNKTPYLVLISELLLKRTTAIQVNKTINQFIQEFPNIEKLASSDDNKLVNMIKPLGLYNRRIKTLKKISEQLLKEYNCEIPNSYDKLIKLFGVGKYIANAILCFYFKERVPIVDTNVIRIFKKYFNFISSKKYPEDDPDIWIFAENILPDKNYVNFNYSLLDFGQLICKAKNPKCEKCILNQFCHSYNQKEL